MSAERMPQGGQDSSLLERPLVWLTRLPIVRQLLDLGYAAFARNRLRLTGRCTSACSLTRER